MKFNPELVRKAMWEYASSVGYPLSGMTPKEFLEKKHHVGMWQYLKSKGLVKPEWKKQYIQQIKLQYKIHYMRNRR